MQSENDFGPSQREVERRLAALLEAAKALQALQRTANSAPAPAILQAVPLTDVVAAWAAMDAAIDQAEGAEPNLSETNPPAMVGSFCQDDMGREPGGFNDDLEGEADDRA